MTASAPATGTSSCGSSPRTAAVSIETEGILHAAYEADTGIYDEVPDGTVITENFTAANTGTGPSLGLLTGATYVAAYTAHLNGDIFLGGIRFEWPGGYRLRELQRKPHQPASRRSLGLGRHVP